MINYSRVSRLLFNLCKIILIWMLLLLASCESHRLRTMTIGFDDCELIFSVHDRCKQIDEEQIFVFTFQSDHSGVRFSQDNLTLSAEDFSLEASQGCNYTREYRIGYQADPSPAPEFQWTILENNQNWTAFLVQLRECRF